MPEINPNEGIPLKSSGVAAIPASKVEPIKFDRTGLEATVAKALAALQSDEDVADDDEAGEEAEAKDDAKDGDDEADEKAEKKEDEGEDEETESDEEDDAEAAVDEAKPAKGAGKDSKTPTLPAAYRRSLKADGWEDAEIDGHYAKLGDSFLKTAAKIHKSRTDETARWAALGRQQRTQSPQQQQQQKPEPFQAIKPLDPVKLKEQYGDDAMVDAVVGPVNAAIAQINKMMPTIEATQQQSRAQEENQLVGQIESFFGSKDIANYAELYGKAGDATFGQPHMEARNKVLELADALIAGAKAQGRQLGLNDALLVAHDSLSGDYKLKAARKEITTTLKKREKGLSLKPGSKVSKPAAVSGAPATRNDLEKKVGSRLKAVFG